MSTNRYFSTEKKDVSNKDNQTVINDFMDQLCRDIQGNVIEKTDRLRYNEQIFNMLNQNKKENKTKEGYR